MMRALALLSSAAVALIALPATAGANNGSTESVAAASRTVSQGASDFLSQPSVLGVSTGMLLWLSVGFVAFVLAVVAVGRAKARLIAAAGGRDSEFAVVRPDFGLGDVATAVR